MKGRVLLVDDDVDVLKINAKYLNSEGYKVVFTNSSQKIKDILLGNMEDEINFAELDCIVLDVMMPKVDGFELCSLIREKYNIPIIFLSGKADEDDKLNGLIIGADDYITKPYSMKELATRILVNIRRNNKNTNNSHDNEISFPPLKIDIIEHKAYYNDEELILSKKEYDMLYLLASNPNTIITFEEIGTKLWGIYSEDDRKNVMVCASRLRKKIGNYSGLENIIENVWTKGYKFVYNK